MNPVNEGDRPSAPESTFRVDPDADAQRLQSLVSSILDTAVEGIILIDVAGRITSANPAALRMFGYRADDLIGRSIDQLMPEPYCSEHHTYLQRYLRTGERRLLGGTREVKGLRRDGALFPMDLSVNEVKWDHQRLFIGIFRDISEKRAMEEALRRERDLAESLIDTAPVAVLVLDLDGRVIRFNRFFARLGGRELEAVQGSDWFATFVPADERTRARNDFARLVRGGTESVESVCTVDAGGRRHRLEWHCSLLRDGQETIGVLAIGLDVTERQRIEEQLLHAQKMEAIGRLAGGIAHDFNNLLMGVIGCCRMALDRLDDDHKARPLVEDISASAQRSIGLTRQLLTFGRKSAVSLGTIDLNEVVRRTRTIALSLLGEDVRLNLDLHGAPLPVVGDATQLEQVLLNLVVNARDAMPRGGRLSIVTRQWQKEAGAGSGPAGLPPGDYVELEVADTGIGMTPEVRQRAFEPFFTTKPAGDGTGLGLSTVFGIVSRLGGVVTVASEPGRGSTFTVVLPRSAVTPAPAREGAAVVARRGAGETVLMVEDEPLVRRTLQDSLETLGYRVLVAANAAAAERQVAMAGVVDVLLSDVVLPDCSGPELARRLRRSRPELPVLFMSAHSRQHLIDTGKLNERDRSLEKPFSDEQLAVGLRELLERGQARGAD